MTEPTQTPSKDKYLAVLVGGIGEDTWDKEVEISAVDFADAHNLAQARAVDAGGQVYALEVWDYPVTNAQRIQKQYEDSDRLRSQAVIRSQELERDLVQATQRIAELESRIGPIDPGGGDRIDELESCIRFLRHDKESLEQANSELLARLEKRVQDFNATDKARLDEIGRLKVDNAKLRAALPDVKKLRYYADLWEDGEKFQVDARTWANNAEQALATKEGGV